MLIGTRSFSRRQLQMHSDSLGFRDNFERLLWFTALLFTRMESRRGAHAAAKADTERQVAVFVKHLKCIPALEHKTIAIDLGHSLSNVEMNIIS